MSVLSQDYERLQNASIANKDVVDNYKQAFANQNITLAHQSVSEYPYLVMGADNLNNLVDTINYMQQIWADDKIEFEGWLRGMCDAPSAYDSTKVYDIGEVAYYQDTPYFCIEHGTTGDFDNSKWLLIKLNDMGVTLKGRYSGDVLYEDGDMVWTILGGSLQWGVRINGSQFLYNIKTERNIRYVSGVWETSPNEVYITDWNGGGV